MLLQRPVLSFRCPSDGQTRRGWRRGRIHIVGARLSTCHRACHRGMLFLVLLTNATLVCDVSDVKSAVILSSYLSICPVTDISATVIPIGVKFCMMVHIGTGQSFILGAEPPCGLPKSPIYVLRFSAIFGAFPFSPRLTSPLSFHTSLLFYFDPVPRSQTGEKDADRMHSEWLRHTNAIPTANILYLSVRQSRLAGRIMFSIVPSSVRLSVCSSVCYQLVNIILRKRVNRF